MITASLQPIQPRYRRVILVATLLGAALARVPAVGQTACTVGPDFCPGDPRFPPALAAKKAKLSQNFPAKLVALLDRDGQCLARVIRAPDGFSIKTVSSDGAVKNTFAWDSDEERIAIKQVTDGTLRVFYMFNAAHRFACNNEPSYDKQADYVAADDVNTSQAITCKKAGADAICQ